MRKSFVAEIEDVVLFKQNLLKWAAAFPVCSVFDSSEKKAGLLRNGFDLIAGIGSLEGFIPSENSFDTLKIFYEEKKDWLFGHLGYDLKNETEELNSENFDGVRFPKMHFFRPKYIFILRGNILEIQYLAGISSEKEVENLFHEIRLGDLHLLLNSVPREPDIKCRFSKDEYIHTVNKIKDHIHRGDIYEMNYCMEFFSENSAIDPPEVFGRLNESSQTPFTAFYRMNDKYLLCASPERYLKKEGRKIISQPIKGTSKRGRNAYEDVQVIALLSEDEKERSENVMIVDLVRNDLSKTCDQVKVDELCRVYTFRQWHQMISTVSGELREGIHFTDVIKKSFPMGSMTGAPKVRAMELIEQYESTKRGLYSGAVGYITPEGDFDLNVVIRSILYNAASNYLSFQVGSAITANSFPENEYNECLLKAKGMFEALKTKYEVRSTKYEATTASKNQLSDPVHASAI
jgi:para-aminobenzoate synthetase component 1